MDRRGALVAIVGVVATLCLPQTASAFGYRDTGFDPDDRPAEDCFACWEPDIRSSTRKVWVDDEGRAWFTLTLRAYEDFGRPGQYEFYVRLDTRAGPAADFRMHMLDTGDSSISTCKVRRKGSDRYREGVLRSPGSLSPPPGDRAWCRVPLRWLRPTKQIRWGVYSPGIFGHDHAPGPYGWYA